MCIQAIFEKIYSYKGEVLLKDVVTCLKAISEDIDNNVKVTCFSKTSIIQIRIKTDIQCRTVQRRY